MLNLKSTGENYNMRKMLDKKEIEKIIDEHGGTGGSDVSVTVNPVTNKVDSITIDGETKAVASDTIYGASNESYWTDLTINGSNKLIPNPVIGYASQDGNYWESLSIGGVTKATNAATPDGKTIVVNEPQRLIKRIKGAKAAGDAELATAIGGWLEKGSTTVTPILSQEKFAGFWSDNTQLPYWELSEGMTWSDLLTAIYGSVPAMSSRAQIEIHVFQNGVEVQGWSKAQASYSPGTRAINVNAATGANRISITQEVGMESNQFRCKVYPVDSSTAITFNSEDEIELTLNGLVIAADTYHPVDGRFLPVDGSTIRLNINNQLQGFSGDYNDLSNKPQIAEADNKTIVIGQDGLETVVGGYISEIPGGTLEFVNNASNMGYASTSEPLFTYNNDTQGLLDAMGLATTLGLRPNQFTTTNDYNVIVKVNGETVWEMVNGNVAYNMMGPGGTAAILVNAASGPNRISINTPTAQQGSNYFRIKVYNNSSSAMTFQSTDVVTLYIEGPDPSSPAVNVYHPIDGRFVPIDGVTITLNGNNQLQAASSGSELYAHFIRFEASNAEMIYGYLVSDRSTAYDIPGLAAYLYSKGLVNYLKAMPVNGLLTSGSDVMMATCVYSGNATGITLEARKLDNAGSTSMTVSSIQDTVAAL